MHFISFQRKVHIYLNVYYYREKMAWKRKKKNGRLSNILKERKKEIAFTCPLHSLCKTLTNHDNFGYSLFTEKLYIICVRLDSTGIMKHKYSVTYCGAECEVLHSATLAYNSLKSRYNQLGMCLSCGNGPLNWMRADMLIRRRNILIQPHIKVATWHNYTAHYITSLYYTKMENEPGKEVHEYEVHLSRK